MIAAPASAPDKRRAERVALDVPVRLAVGEVGTEYEGTLNDVSLSGVSVRCAARPQLDTPVVAYVEGITRFEGRVARLLPGALAITFELSEAKKARLRAKLEGLAPGGLAETPAAPKPNDRKLTLPDGLVVPATVRDASVLGAVCVCRYRPPVGSSVRLGDQPARVVAHTKDGLSLEFDRYWESVAPKA